MKKNVLIKIKSALLLIIFVFSVNSKVFALEPGGVLINTEIPGSGGLEKIGGNIIGTIMVTGVVLSVIIMIVIGFKYMMGSVEEKAGYKKAMIPYVVGCIIFICAPTISNVVYKTTKNLKGQAYVLTSYHPTDSRRMWQSIIILYMGMYC